MITASKTSLAIVAVWMNTACSQAEFNPSKPAREIPISADDSPSVDKSTMTVSEPNFADGVTPTYINLILKNAAGKLLEGKTPILSVSGDNNVVMPCTTSNANGQSRCTVYSTRAEMKWVRIQLGAEMVGQIQFARPPVSKTLSAIVTTGDVQKTFSHHTIMGSAGTIESQQIVKNEFGQKSVHFSHLSTMADD